MALYEILADGTPRKVAGGLKDYTAGDGISIENGVISTTKKKDLLVEWTTKYNFAGGTIPIPRSSYSQYDFIIIEVIQYNAGGDGILAKTNIIHEIQSPQTHQSSVTIYSERKARMILLKAVFGANNIALSGIDANPYGTTNASITSSDGYYTNNIWGVKL